MSHRIKRLILALLLGSACLSGLNACGFKGPLEPPPEQPQPSKP